MLAYVGFRWRIGASINGLKAQKINALLGGERCKNHVLWRTKVIRFINAKLVGDASIDDSTVCLSMI
ncbi:hypothetical protein DHW03_17675 [Pedobacter yonginense]|uniref:Uncharacterized protein n=1 Tax=Pedobacter yonginense TaxID=651869 RepID=A0A317EJT3_9SPHI|nr:hypothetical protein DHW03_17675 [Pedobacter yonginense]